MKKRIGLVFGTRPDAIKMAPVVFALRQRPDEFTPVAISTGQHRQMLDQVLQVFDVSADIELDLMRHNQTLNGLTRRILEAMDSLLRWGPSIERFRSHTSKPGCAVATSSSRGRKK